MSNAELDLDLGDEAPARREKAPGAFRTISEVSEELDVPAHVLRFWESRFPQIAPMKRGGGRRYYRPADVALLRGVRRMLYDEGLTIKGLQKVFRERGPRHVSAAADAPRTETPASPAPALAPLDDATRARLRAVVATLETTRDRLAAG